MEHVASERTGGWSRRLILTALAAGLFFSATAESHAAGIPFVDLPKPYEDSGLLVSLPSSLIGGAVGMVVGALFIPPMIVVSILPGIGLFDAVLKPLQWGYSIGEHTVGRVVGLPLWVTKKLVWDVPTALLFGRD